MAGAGNGATGRVVSAVAIRPGEAGWRAFPIGPRCRRRRFQRALSRAKGAPYGPLVCTWSVPDEDLDVLGMHRSIFGMLGDRNTS